MGPLISLIDDHREYSRLLSDLEQSYRELKEGDITALHNIKKSLYLIHLEMELHFSREEYILFSNIDHPIITQLKQEHGVIRNKFLSIDATLISIIDEEGHKDMEKIIELKELITDFRSFKGSHVIKEETILFPYVKETLSSKDMDTIQSKFREFDSIVAANLL